MTQPLVTSGRQWRKAREEGYVITLPSGQIARLRPVALDVLVASGRIPDLLTPLAAETLWEGPQNIGADDDKPDYGKMAAMLPKALDLYNIICKAAFLDPRIVDNPKEDNEISIEDVGVGDKMAVFQLSTQGAEVLRSFRDRQIANVADVHDSEDDEQPTEQPDTD